LPNWSKNPDERNQAIWGRIEGAHMSITVRVTGIFIGDPVSKAIVQDFRTGDTPKKILSRLDKDKALGRELGRRFFGKALKSGRATFLLNGDRLDIPDDLDRPLTEGDEISVLSAIAGG
jgi:molybdopterin converting factor small subunit